MGHVAQFHFPDLEEPNPSGSRSDARSTMAVIALHDSGSVPTNVLAAERNEVHTFADNFVSKVL